MIEKWIFITGGCGYIGSHLAAVLKEKTDYKVFLIDKRAADLQHTIRYSDLYADEEFDSDLIRKCIQDQHPVSVVHLGAIPTITAGIIDPISQWKVNVSQTITFIEHCMAANIDNFIFASTSSVYADSDEAVTETSPLNPTNAYSSTKLAVEHILRDCWVSHGFPSVSLRVFNAAGSHNHYDLGELHGSTHLLSSVMNAAVNNGAFNIFGRDWNTPDGTAIRDYTHVLDIADAIIASIEWSKTNKGCHTFNIGKGSGNSVQEMVNTTERILNKELLYRYGPRREGDSAKRFANIDKISKIIGWIPKRTLDDIVRDEYKWYNSATYNNLTNAGIVSTY